jgi:predicted enzyme related to lactoylglutathione lyase
MKSMPIRYVHDMDAARRFYEALGFTHAFTSRKPRHGEPSVWTELAGSSGGLALHHVPDDVPAGASLGFEADEPLEQVVERLYAAGYELETEITDESFGRSFRVRDPEGLVIQIDEQDHELQA